MQSCEQHSHEPTVPKELTTPNYRTCELSGDVGHDKDWMRQDPSNVLKVRDTYYVWYAKYKPGNNGYSANIVYATSKDGFHWSEQGLALGKGEQGAWDSYGVVAPYVAVIDDTYYLFYNGTNADKPWEFKTTLRHTGIAISKSPIGPWQRFEGNPILSPTEDADAWDSLLVTDPHLIVRDGMYWMYHKGGDPQVTPETTRWGVAIADKITGPYIKHAGNPVLDSGHTTCLWPHREGVAALVDNAGPERFTVQYAPDGIHFQRACKLAFIHTGCGPCDLDAFTNAVYGRGITWGLAQHMYEDGTVGIVRFDVDLKAPERPADHHRTG